MSSKIGGGGEIIVLTVDHFNSFVHGWRFGSFIFLKKGRQARIWLIASIFTMPVDVAMKVADLACEELGMMGSEDEDKRGAYADNVWRRGLKMRRKHRSLYSNRSSGGVWRLRIECGEDGSHGVSNQEGSGF